ncbi:MAG: PAAR domain-containing protein [Polyangiaceae bacterium]|nr:PAAR domain-containing protein [Polyangiaceae bacterium]
MKPAARSADMSLHGGNVIGQAAKTFIGGQLAARKGDPHACPAHGRGVVTGGAARVLVVGSLRSTGGVIVTCRPCCTASPRPTRKSAVVALHASAGCYACFEPMGSSRRSREPIARRSPPRAGRPSLPCSLPPMPPPPSSRASPPDRKPPAYGPKPWRKSCSPTTPLDVGNRGRPGCRLPGVGSPQRHAWSGELGHGGGAGRQDELVRRFERGQRADPSRLFRFAPVQLWLLDEEDRVAQAESADHRGEQHGLLLGGLELLELAARRPPVEPESRPTFLDLCRLEVEARRQILDRPRHRLRPASLLTVHLRVDPLLGEELLEPRVLGPLGRQMQRRVEQDGATTLSGFPFAMGREQLHAASAAGAVEAAEELGQLSHSLRCLGPAGQTNTSLEFPCRRSGEPLLRVIQRPARAEPRLARSRQRPVLEVGAEGVAADRLLGQRDGAQEPGGACTARTMDRDQIPGQVVPSVLDATHPSRLQGQQPHRDPRYAGGPRNPPPTRTILRGSLLGLREARARARRSLVGNAGQRGGDGQRRDSCVSRQPAPPEFELLIDWP